MKDYQDGGLRGIVMSCDAVRMSCDAVRMSCKKKGISAHPQKQYKTITNTRTGKTTRLEEKCASKKPDIEESPIMSSFKFLTYPTLGNMPGYIQKKLENYYGTEAYNAKDASRTSAVLNIFLYAGALVAMGVYHPSFMKSNLGGITTIATIFCNMYMETATRFFTSKQEGACGSLAGKFLFFIPEVIMRKVDSTKKKKKKKLEEQLEEEKNKPTKLELFQNIIDQKQDELNPTLEAISKVCKKLLYEHNQNEIAKGILDLHRPYIEEYLEKAGEYVKNYRGSTQYLENFDIEKLKKDIKAYSEKVKLGKKFYATALQEKKDALRDIEEIKENREEIEARLCEAEATLQSLRTSIMKVETGKNEEQAMKEIQRSVSTLSKALDKNFGKVEEVIEEKIEEGGMEYGT